MVVEHLGQCNRRGATIISAPRRLLADFMIGAHALLSADRLMTFDTKVYGQDFPELRLYRIPRLRL